MRILIDANILLDVALARPGLHEASEAALSQCGRDEDQALRPRRNSTAMLFD